MTDLICSYHPDRAAIGTCINCGKPVCLECKVVLAEKCLCNPCADATYGSATAALRAHRPNWFARHLNWTTVLSWFGGMAASFVAAFIVGITTYGSDFQHTEVVAYFAGYTAALAWLLITNGWVLRKKGRSEWYLLLLLVPFGFFFLLSLENRNAVNRAGGRPTVN